MSADQNFSGDIARARQLGFDAIAERIQEIARGTSSESSGDVARDKLIVETDLKLLAKWDPRRYGDKTLHTGPDGESPVRVNLYIPDNGRA